MQSESIQSLAHRLKGAQQIGQPGFIFLLGAGASRSSGIPIASWMIRDFQRNLRYVWDREGRPSDNFDSWLHSKPGWKRNETESDYAKYFEAWQPTEAARRGYLNYWMKGASPGWGYFCLAQLLARSYVGVVVTTNFDDLMYESCTMTSVMRPRVYSTIDPYVSIEQEPNRSTIIKLHGDYLYRSYKTTGRETKDIDEQLVDEVASLFRRHDVIVVGYSGEDKRIMELLEKVPMENAVYWCTYKDTPLPDRVKEIVSEGHRDHWFKVMTEGFDEFMDVLVHELDFTLPSIMQPIQDLINAMPGRIEGSQSRYITEYLDQTIQQIQEEAKDWTRIQGGESLLQTPLLLRLEAMAARRKGEYQKAIDIYEHLVDLPKQNTCEVLIEYAVTLELIDRYSDALEQTARIAQSPIQDSENLGNYGWLLTDLGKYSEGINYLKQAISKGPGLIEWQAHLAMILSEDGQISEAMKKAQELTDMNPYDGRVWAIRSMIESLAGYHTETSLEYGQTAVTLNPAGFNENLALAFALSGSGDNEGAIAALLKIDGERDEVFSRCLGHFQILVGDSNSAVASLQEAVKKTEPAKRPKIFALYGVALLAQGNDKQALDTFNSASEARNPGRTYKADDELAFALCKLGGGQTVSGVSKIKALATQYRHMKGLLLEFSVLLSVMQTRGIEGCDQCITLIDGALDTGSS